MKNIGFRIDEDQYAELERRAELAGVSVHEISRRILLESLRAEPNPDGLRLELGKFGNELSELRRDLGSSVQLLLFALGNIPVEQAKELVEELLSRRAA